MLRFKKTLLGISAGAALIALPVFADGHRLEAWQEAEILDKPKIAQEVYDQVMGLRQDGNPHIPLGSRLRDAQLAEPRDESYREELRRKRASLYGRRTPDWSSTSFSPASSTEEGKVTSTRAEEKSSPFLRNAVTLAFLMTGALLWWWRPRRG